MNVPPEYGIFGLRRSEETDGQAIFSQSFKKGADEMLAAIFIAVIVIFAGAVYVGTKSGRIRHIFEIHPLLPKVLLSGYIIFAGCFMFPIRSEMFPLDFWKLYLLAAGYGAIALAFAGIWGPGRERMVYVMTFVLTVIGMACLYLLEFGEASNTYNFTLLNMISYLVIIPIGTTAAYRFIAGRLKRR